MSNYTIRHLEKLLKDCKVVPAVNQVELHVFLQQPELLEYCKHRDITVEAYSPLAHSFGLDNTLLKEIAKKYIADNGLKENFAGNYTEVYIKTIDDIKQPSKWITEIYIPIFPKVEIIKQVVKSNPTVANPAITTTPAENP